MAVRVVIPGSREGNEDDWRGDRAMRVIDIATEAATLDELIKTIAQEDMIIKRDGHVMARLQRFTDEDFDDWLFEHDPKNIAKADAARAQARKGKASTLDEVRSRLTA